MMLSIAERAPIYGWLSRLLVQEIDEPAWSHLARDPIRQILSQTEPGFGTWSAVAFSETLASSLAEEYARLFLLPGGVSPFVSAWLDGDRDQLGASLATMVTRGLEVLGREPVLREPWGRLPLDHLAFVFDVVSESISMGEPMQVEVATHLDTELLGPWLVPFGERVRERATTPLYRGIGSLIAELHRIDPSDADG